MPANVAYISQSGRAQIPADQQLNFTKLMSLLSTNNVSSIEQALEILSRKHGDYMKFHTLMYSSFSLQSSTFEEPRALVFGPEGKFIFTFNGNPNQVGGFTFETVEYSEKNRRFEFREIAFKKYPQFSREELGLERSEIAYETPNFIVSKPNPQKCLQCHGENATPIWQSYFLWPGAYGSDDDQLHMSFDHSTWNPNNEGFFRMTKKPSSQGRVVSFKPGQSDAELEGMIRYATAKPAHPRYKFLPAQIVEIGALKYAQGATFEELNFAEQAKQQSEWAKSSFDWPSRPNLFLLTALHRWNSDRLLAKLKSKRLGNAFKSAEWTTITRHESQLAAHEVIPVMAAKIEKLFYQFQFLKTRPTLQQIQEALTKNLRLEFGMQLERATRHEAHLGKGKIQYQEWVGIESDGSHRLHPREPYRMGLSVIKDAKEFYTAQGLLKKEGVAAEIALGMETDDQFLITAVNLLLQDRGIDLENYNMNLRQMGLTFHTGGLDEVLIYLGVFEPQPY